MLKNRKFNLFSRRYPEENTVVTWMRCSFFYHCSYITVLNNDDDFAKDNMN
jgi:hypothetical protein